MMDLFERERQLEQARQLAFNRIAGLINYVNQLRDSGHGSDDYLDELMDEVNAIYTDYKIQELQYSRDIFERCNIDVEEDSE